jgi:hypothetical protein
VAAMSKVFHPSHDAVYIIEQVAENDDDPAFLEPLCKIMQNLAGLGLALCS